MGIWPNSTGMVLGWSLTEIVQMVLISCISRSRGQKIGFQKAIFKNLLVWTYKAQGFHIWYIASSTKVVQIIPLGSKMTPSRGHKFTLNYIMKSFNITSFEPLMGIWPNAAGMIPGSSPTKIIQMVLIGCISRSRGQKLGFQNAIFKNLLVWNYKAQSFHIRCITSSRGSLPIFGWQH